MPQLGGFELGYGELGAPTIAPGVGAAFRSDGLSTVLFSVLVFGSFEADGAGSAFFNPSTTSVVLTQEALEYAGVGQPPVELTQEALEYTNWPPPPPVIQTQEALEFVEWPANEQLWSSQVCLEVVLYGEFVVVPPPSGNRIIPQYIKRRNLFSH